MIRLIASDVDGTLLLEGTTDLNPEIYDTIRQLKESGILFAAASGRQFCSVKNVFSPVEDDVILISNNGAYISYRGEVMDCRCILADVLEEIISYIRTMENVFYILTTPEKDYTDCNDPELLQWLEEGYHIPMKLVEDVREVTEPVIKVSVFGKDQDAAGMALPAIEQFRGKAHVMASGDHWVDFMEVNVDKGNALMALQRRFGIKKDETMAFGDNNNDIGMLRAAAESYAVANAREEVKEAAKYVLPDEGRDSVLHVLKKLVQREG